jgi:hypothetical protein
VRLLAAAVLCALVAAAGASAATTPTTAATAPVYDGNGRLVQTPFVPPPAQRLTKQQAIDGFLAFPKVAHWLAHYPRKTWVTDATYDDKAQVWKVNVWSGKAGEVATGTVVDATAAVTSAWTGPQVAWGMARGAKGSFGGKRINETWLWLTFCGLFLLGLVDWRRPLSPRNLDLFALVFLSLSLWYFNEGNVFTSVPLVYPSLFYLAGRTIWLGVRGRPTRAGRPLWPVWVLAAATVFVAGFRVGLNVKDSNVIDVGYSGVIGADRVWHGQSPYGHFPTEGNLKPCGPADANGEIRDRIQTNGRCESANDQGDTYGPAAYLVYLPGYWIFGWSGKWDKLPAAHFTSIAFDLLAILGLALVGKRFGGGRLAATLAFAWATFPFTQYVSSTNANDAIPPVFLIWGFWLVTSPWARGLLSGLSAAAKFAALVVLPLWATYPERRRPAFWKFVAGVALAICLTFWVLLLEPSPLHAARVFWDRTVGYQLGRQAPFSLWDWRQYHAGLPDLHVVQRVLQVLLVLGAVAAALWPRRKTPFQLGALTAALLIGFELVLTYWFYTYIAWFFPFVVYAVLAGEPRRAPVAETSEADGRRVRELVPAG